AGFARSGAAAGRAARDLAADRRHVGLAGAAPRRTRPVPAAAGQAGARIAAVPAACNQPASQAVRAARLPRRPDRVCRRPPARTCAPAAAGVDRGAPGPVRPGRRGRRWPHRRSRRRARTRCGPAGMSLLEILVGVSGLAIGYWLVNVFLSSPKPSSDSPQDQPDDANRPHVIDIGARHWTEVLGVAEDADEAQVTAAYRRRISEYHPDRVAMMADESRALAGERTAEINAAYEQAMRQITSTSGSQ